jgi:RNA polymerase sigma-70 factor (ECF subfamily)
MNVPNQEYLIQRACSGDANAFEELVKAYYPSILNFSYRLLGNRADAEDVTQEVFLRVGRKLTSLKNSAVFDTWLYSIASSASKDMMRQRSRQADRDARYHECHHVGDCPPRSETGLWELVRRLPRKLKEAVVLVYWEGVNHAHAASVLNCAESTVSWRVHEAKKQLKEMMEGDE